MREKISEVTRINTALAKRIKEELDQNVYLCYQCVKCTGGCPLSKYFDWQPNQVMRALQLGEEDIALNSQTPWLCASCQTCSTRCPQDLDIAGIMTFLTREALARGIKPQVPEVDMMNEAFLREVKIWGRNYELGLMAEMKLRTRNLTQDLDLGMKMFSKMKMPIFPDPARAPKKVKPIPVQPNTIGYYPGCSLHSTSAEYNKSVKAVSEVLGLKLVEPKGWLCCGSTPIHRSHPETALRLPMENLRLLEQSGLDEVVMPCAACFNHTKTAQYEMRHDDEVRDEVNSAMNYEYKDSVLVSNLPEAYYRRLGPDKIRSKVKHWLGGLKVVCYYGCLLTRPPKVTEASRPENPIEMDEIVAALGAEVVDWSYKTCCCGATHTLTRPDIVLDLSSHLIEQAQSSGADIVVVACPMCHTNLDARQFQMKLEKPMPILFLTQLMAIALGIPDKAALNKNMVDPRPMLRSKDIL